MLAYYYSMRTIEQWFAEYDVSHKNETNKLVHWVCVPLIFFSVISLFHEIRFGFLDSMLPSSLHFFNNLATLLIVGGLIFYFRISFTIFLLMVFASGLCLIATYFLERSGVNLFVSLGIFISAWIGQFLGHNIEGAKPSFLKDLQFLFVGPAWCIAFLLRRWGIQY